MRSSSTRRTKAWWNSIGAMVSRPVATPRARCAWRFDFGAGEPRANAIEEGEVSYEAQPGLDSKALR